MDLNTGTKSNDIFKKWFPDNRHIYRMRRQWDCSRYINTKICFFQNKIWVETEELKYSNKSELYLWEVIQGYKSALFIDEDKNYTVTLTFFCFPNYSKIKNMGIVELDYSSESKMFFRNGNTGRISLFIGWFQ